MIIDFNKLEYKNLPWIDIMSFSTEDSKGISDYFWASAWHDLILIIWHWNTCSTIYYGQTSFF